MSNPKKLKKPKKRSITALKKELWKYFSLFIRTRDNFRCFTCDRYATGGGMHAGHYIPNSIGGVGLRYEETNVHAQCYHCNINLSGNWPVYRERMIQKYGEEYVKALEARRSEVTKDFDYQTLIEKYKGLASELH